jgi:hypothetical protein
VNVLLRLPRLLAVSAAIGLALVGVAGCSGSVPKDQLATTINEQLVQQGVQPDGGTVNCPEDLAAEVGKSVRCSITTGGQPVDVVAKVTSVEGSTARYDITTEARPVLKSVLEAEVGKQVGQQAGTAIDKTECTGDLPPQVGQSVTCTVSAGAESLDLKVAVTSVDGGRVNFSIEQA